MFHDIPRRTPIHLTVYRLSTTLVLRRCRAGLQSGEHAAVKLSVIILTHNRRDTLLRTLERVEQQTAWLGRNGEVWVVDNGSTDQTHQAVSSGFPTVRMIRCASNEGVWARQYAIDQASGQYVCFVDDDSYPTPNALAWSLGYLDDHRRTAAVTGRVVLADGTCEASALPAIPAMGGLCIRRAELERAGGLHPCRGFIRQAEEYDLAFRILALGYRLHRSDNAVYGHEKQTGTRSNGLVHRLDLRNNLVVLDRYVPDPLRRVYREDWIQRYEALARADGHHDAAKRGRAEADRWATDDDSVARRPAHPATIETVFQLEHQTRLVRQWSDSHRVRRVCIADVSKNIYASYRACCQSGLEICAVVDPHRAFSGLRYRGIPVRRDTDALRQGDGVVLSNVNPAHIDGRFAQLGRQFAGPILRFWPAPSPETPPEQVDPVVATHAGPTRRQ